VILTLPWALMGLAALPALAAIYWLRNRSRRMPVSSLILWMDLPRAREGGRFLRRMEAPLALFLELAALALLVLAAAGPLWPLAGHEPPLVIVLDDSFSMLAGGDDSPRRRGETAVEAAWRDHPGAAVTFLLAGSQPQRLDEASKSDGFSAARAAWRCRWPSAALEPTVALALSLAGPHGRVLVVTDQAPPAGLVTGRLLWRALGQNLPNAAVVHASRRLSAGRDRCLLEITNFSASPRTVTLALTRASDGAALARQSVSLGPRQPAPLFFDLPPDTAAVRAAIDDDALPIDNEVTLLAVAPPKVAVAVAVDHAALRASLLHGLEATGLARIVTAAPDLYVTEKPPPALPPETWSLRLVVDKDAEAFVGPFIVDRRHPLTDGLDLAGAIWAAAKEPPLPGTAVIAAGNVPLLTDTERPDGRHDLRLRLQPDQSPLVRSPNWPILLWNLLQYRAAHLPGIREPNVRLGDNVPVRTAAGERTVRVIAPDGEVRDLAVHDGRAVAGADQCGVFEVQADGLHGAFAAGALRPDESDLSSCTAGVWGEWTVEADLPTAYRPIAALFLAAALGLLLAHQAVLRRRAAGGGL
jgi:hypothetical protein